MSELCVVVLNLIDSPYIYHHDPSYALFQLLYQKMQHQIKGFVRWQERREILLNEIKNNIHDDEENDYFVPKPFSSWINHEEYLKKLMGFLPIEFSLNRECLIAYSLISKLFSLPEQMFEGFEFVESQDFEYINQNNCDKNEALILSSLLFDQNETELFERLPNQLKYSKDFVKKAVEMCGSIIKYIEDDDLLQDREIVWNAVNNSSISLLENLPKKYLDDEDIVFTSCLLCTVDADLMSDRLKSDKSFLLKLVEKAPQTFSFIHSNLKNDSDFVRKCLEKAGTRLFDYIPSEILKPLLKDLETLKFISSKNFIADYFSRTLQKFYKEEMENIRNELSNDREFACECISNQTTCASFFSPEIRKEKEFIKLSKNLNMATDKTLLDYDFFKEMYRLDIQNFHYMPQETKENKSFVLDLMDINGLGLEFLDRSLRTDLDVITRAIQQNGSSLYVALAKERRNEKLQEMAIERSGYFEYDNEKTLLGTIFRKHLRRRLDKEYYGFDIPQRFCTATRRRNLNH